MTIKPTNTHKRLRVSHIGALVLFKALFTAAIYSIFTFISLSFYKYLFKLISGTLLLFGLEHAVHTFFATDFSNNLILWTATRLAETYSRLTIFTRQYKTRRCYTRTIQYKVLFHVYNTIPRTVTLVQYNTTYSYTCAIQCHVLLHVCNTIPRNVTRVQYKVLFPVYNTIPRTVTRVQYNTTYCYTCAIQYHVLLHAYNTRYCSPYTIQYHVLLHVCNTIPHKLHVCNTMPRTVTRVQYNTTYSYTCAIKCHVLLHVCNTIPRTVTRVQYKVLFPVYNTIPRTVTRVQYNTRYCSTCTIQYHVLLHVYNTIQGTVPRVQTKHLLFHLHIEALRVPYKTQSVDAV